METTGAKTSNFTGKRVNEWRAAWGGSIDDLKTNPGYFITSSDGVKFGTSATGLALLAGLMTIEEQKRGAINNPVTFAIPESRQSIWGFQHSARMAKSTTRTPSRRDHFSTARELGPRRNRDGFLCAVDRPSNAKLRNDLRDTAGAVVFYA